MNNPKLGRPLKVTAGTVLFHADDECPGFVIVRSGTIRVSLIAENGREITLYRVRPGEVCLQTFGCLVEGRRYSAEGIAETDIVAELVPATDFHRLVSEDDDFRTHLFAAVAHRFADLEQLVEDVVLIGFEARLARALLRLRDTADGIDTTHEALAIDTGSGRAAVSRQLGRFAKDGLIELQRGRIGIIDSARLQQLAEELGD
ncbi:Crp/Fnr family transcriptional regulator [uncultured Sphingorhabdus sp.]|uniref:Crp/Fnr family transcriptional regulator n=1 Tax=uncultured Sphingorhabdus sp. TaxID=1686106 RepID=UPI0026342B3D|nr:Crp/Fnr family transcriptional regulator [uncultured Sphingorhabdus sp.]HMS21290.1 Crp/Fnr family transcriptional regulator [Sphingorhabdus sp.]